MPISLTEIVLILVVLIIVIPLLNASIKIIREYERAVLFRLGRLVGAKGPGLILIVPFVDNLTKVDLRVVTVDVPKQEIITRDNVSVKVDAVIYYRAIDPIAAITKVSNYHYSIMMLGQTVLRDVIGQVDLDDLLQKRDELNKKIQEIIDETAMSWGIKVTAVTLKSVELPEELMRAMAKQAEAERWRRARIIEAEGERQASAILIEAASMYEKHPTALRLREFQTMIEIAREKALVVVTETGASDIGKTIAMYKALKEREER
ncbi:MAG: slipin family protein [Desulfurococcaceae archaeon TW002]